MSCRYGTLYSWKKGFESFSGRYRVTCIVAMSWLILLVDTLLWFPSGYRDRTILDSWRPTGLVRHGVLEKASVVPLDSYVFLHPVLHLCPDAGYSLALFMFE